MHRTPRVPKRLGWVVNRPVLIDTRPLEVLYCFLTTAWGLSLIAPGDAFANSPSFAAMAQLAPDYVWGAVAAVIGIGRIVGIALDMTVMRLFASMGGGIIWTFTAVSMLLTAEAVNTGVAVYGVLSFANFYIFVRLCRACLPPHPGAVQRAACGRE